jgi:hypothetical protein
MQFHGLLLLAACFFLRFAAFTPFLNPWVLTVPLVLRFCGQLVAMQGGVASFVYHSVLVVSASGAQGCCTAPSMLCPSPRDVPAHSAWEIACGHWLEQCLHWHM